MPNTRIKRTNLPGALKAHAILVANNRYDKIGAHLRTPVADAEALAETLITYQDFEPENVHSCLDATNDDHGDEETGHDADRVGDVGVFNHGRIIEGIPTGGPCSGKEKPA